MTRIIPKIRQKITFDTRNPQHLPPEFFIPPSIWVVVRQMKMEEGKRMTNGRLSLLFIFADLSSVKRHLYSVMVQTQGSQNE